MPVLVKNGLVYDGRESPPQKQDILISGERIARLGNFSKNEAREIIDATGCIVTPGFVDINTNSDHHLSLFSEPYQEDFLRQGITTIIGGNCGFSLAPLLNGSLESINKWGDLTFLNINWQTVKEFLNVLEKKGLGVNFGTLIGHATMRGAITQKTHRDLTNKELESLKRIIIDSLEGGAFGLSFGLGYENSKNIPYKELEFLAGAMSKTNKVLAIHLRDAQSNFPEALEEVLRLSRGMTVNLEISHLEPRLGFSEEYLRAKINIEKESATSRINFDVYPFTELALPISNFLPPWLRFTSLDDADSQIRLPYLKERLLSYFLKFKPGDLLIGQTPKNLKFLEGKTLEEFSGSHDMKWPESFLKLMQLTHLKTIIFYKDIDENVLKEFLSSSSAIISSNGASLPLNFFKHPRNCETFPKFLSWVSKENILPIERAVAKITSIPAKKYGIKKRGLIKEGYYADIVVLRDNRPKEVILNGKFVLKDGIPQKILAGSILKSQQND
ncbi:MAG: amidohydrolase family protein [Patescibacteria group bacterium]